METNGRIQFEKELARIRPAVDLAASTVLKIWDRCAYGWIQLKDGTMDVRAFLLQKFSSEERKEVDAALEQGVEAVKTLVLNGFDNITRFNLGQKYKYKLRLDTRNSSAMANLYLDVHHEHEISIHRSF